MRLRYSTLKKITETKNWLTTDTARDIAQALKELIAQAKNKIPLDTDEQIIWDAIKEHIDSQPEKELNKVIDKLKDNNEELKQNNLLLKEKNKALMVKFGL